MLLTAMPTATQAQNTPTDTENTGTRRFWQANLPGGSYMVALDRISSISKHTYVIGGNLRVSEVVIDTNGNSLVRFYYIIPVSENSGSQVASGLTERGKELLDKVGERTGVDGNTMVAKNYPNTTHAKTIEFRLTSEANLNALLNSARTSWIRGRGRQFTIKNE